MEYFFEGKVKSISIKKKARQTEYNVDFRSNYMFGIGNEEKYVAVDEEKHSTILTIETGMFNPITKDIFTFISMHSKETFKVYFDKSTNNTSKTGEGNPNAQIKYEIKKVELIYG